MDDFCSEKGIKREYNVARTPQQNGVAERKNMTLIEAARTMLADSKLPTTFSAKAVSTACYVQNRVLIVNTPAWNRPLVYCDDDDDEDYTIAITPESPTTEPVNSLSLGDEHLDTISATESDELIKSSVENLIPIPSEYEGISDDSCDVPNCDNNCVNVESDLLESLINRDTSIVYSSKIDPILEEFADELAHLAPLSSEIVEACVDDDDTYDDDYDDDFYDCVDI
ncbi:reverse transcriptase domain-containing protein, partial [Tanacetum coccineum]